MAHSKAVSQTMARNVFHTKAPVFSQPPFLRVLPEPTPLVTSISIDTLKKEKDIPMLKGNGNDGRLPAQKPDIQQPDDVPPNHPKETPQQPDPTTTPFPEVDPLPKDPETPIQPPPDAPAPNVPEEYPSIQPSEIEFPNNPEFQKNSDHPKEWP